MNAYDLKDRVAIVTGGAQGIGLAVADRILASGGRVLRSGIAIVRCWTKTIASIGKPDRVHGLTVDIADLAVVEAAAKATVAHFGKVDILVNNAAIVGPNAPTWEISARSLSRCGQCRSDRHVLLLPDGRSPHDRSELRPHRQSQLSGRQRGQSESAGV